MQPAVRLHPLHHPLQLASHCLRAHLKAELLLLLLLLLLYILLLFNLLLLLTLDAGAVVSASAAVM
jgi:hypothetical protein